MLTRCANRLKGFCSPEVPDLSGRLPYETPPGSSFQLSTTPNLWQDNRHGHVGNRMRWGIIPCGTKSHGGVIRKRKRHRLSEWFVSTPKRPAFKRCSKFRDEKSLFPRSRPHPVKLLLWAPQPSPLLIDFPETANDDSDIVNEEVFFWGSLDTSDVEF